MGGTPSSGAIVPLNGDSLARLADPFVRGGRSPLVKAAETRNAVRLLPRAVRVRLCEVRRQCGRSSAVRVCGGSQSCAKRRTRSGLEEADESATAATLRKPSRQGSKPKGPGRIQSKTARFTRARCAGDSSALAPINSLSCN
jgi:hypothetical protein